MPDQDPNAIPEKLVSDLLTDDPDMKDLVEEFIEELPNRVDEIRQAYEHHDWDVLTTLAHQLKGAGGSYGYQPLSSLSAAMEQAFRAHSAECFSAWMTELDQVIIAARKGLEDV